MNFSPVSPSAESAPSTDASFRLVDGDAAVGLLLLCDHASNAIPPEYGNLGLSETELARHIAYDPGAAAVTLGLAERLGVPAVLSTFSRLLIDANRGEDDPTLIMRLSDGTIVPGNAAVDGAERARRIACYHAPYHAAVEAAVERSLALGRIPALVSMHSFTPVWRGRMRPWHAGILWGRDDRLARPLIEALRSDPDLVVGDNEPYTGVLAGDTMFRHGLARGFANALIEVRQDLIAEETGAAEWVERLAPVLASLNARAEAHEVKYFDLIAG